MPGGCVVTRAATHTQVGDRELDTSRRDEAPQDELPAVDVITVLLQQHEEIRGLFGEVGAAQGGDRQDAFDQLRELLARHEAGEEIVLRPLSADLGGQQAVQARGEEEKEIVSALAELETLEVDSPEFAERFERFRELFDEHAASEERDEFRAVAEKGDPETLRRLARRLLAAQKAAPTHPHPSVTGSRTARIAINPFAALIDKARDALSHNES